MPEDPKTVDLPHNAVGNRNAPGGLMLYYSPKWAEKRLPPGVDLVQIAGVWWLIQWDDEFVLCHPFADEWFCPNEALDDLEIWWPDLRHVADVCKACADDPPKKVESTSKST